jgi:Rrf2 family protein
VIRRSGLQAIRVLLELAEAPLAWRSAHDLSRCQQLPEPMLEQLLLRLRRAGLVEARRGRQGGYRLGRAAAELPVAQILAAAQARSDRPAATAIHAGTTDHGDDDDPGARVTAALQRRLQQALERELARITLGELLHDLHSARAALSDESGMLLG